MSLIYHDIIKGKPVAQKRPRFVRRGRFVQVYDPKSSKDYKQLLKDNCQYSGEPYDKPFALTIHVYANIPSSFKKADKEKAEQGLIRPAKKPDVDNYAKGIMDALTGIVWVDDNICLDLIVKKFYSKEPRIELWVESIDSLELPF